MLFLWGAPPKPPPGRRWHCSHQPVDALWQRTRVPSVIALFFPCQSSFPSTVPEPSPRLPSVSAALKGSSASPGPPPRSPAPGDPGWGQGGATGAAGADEAGGSLPPRPPFPPRPRGGRGSPSRGRDGRAAPPRRLLPAAGPRRLESGRRCGTERSGAERGSGSGWDAGARGSWTGGRC